MFNWLKTKTKKVAEVFNFSAFADLEQKKEFKIDEPMTLARVRLEGKAKDFGAEKGRKIYNEHRVKIKNQWINPLQSVNSGYGNAQLSVYNYQPVNYYECYALAQDPLFNKIFNILSNTPFANGGQVAGNLTDDEIDLLQTADTRYNVTNTLRKAVRSSFVSGGCLVYMDFGNSVNLEDPLDLAKINMKNFKGFRQIDPLNITAVNVNTTEPAKPDYMKPSMWYVIGLGNVHASHFLIFEENIPELVMRPMCMYLGMPLTTLIKQDIANSNLVSQGLANLVNRFRNLYLQTGNENFTGAGALNFRQRLEAMSLVQDNFSIYPLKDTETIQQFTTSLAGMDEVCEFFYQIIASKTDITLSILLGKGAQGLSGTLEGERKNFYDRIRTIQSGIKQNIIKMYGIVYGVMNDGKFRLFNDYIFNPLEVADEKEKAEQLRSYVEVARSFIEMGVKPEDVLSWLKQYKDFHLDNMDFDVETESLEDYEQLEQGKDDGIKPQEKEVG